MLYEKLFGNVMALNRYLRMQYIIPEIEKVKNFRILDIGCLDGHFTQYLCGRKNVVFAIDIKDYGIKQALPEVSFYLASGESLPFQDNFFDFVFCSDVFEHINNFEKIIPEICRVLKPGRSCLISTVDGYWNPPLKLRAILLRHLSDDFNKKIMGRFAVSDEDLHKDFMGHVRYDITVEKLEDIFRKYKLILKKKITYCHLVGSLLMELFFSFNEKIRYLIFPLLKLLLPFDRLVTFGKPWQFYLVFDKVNSYVCDFSEK